MEAPGAEEGGDEKEEAATAGERFMEAVLRPLLYDESVCDELMTSGFTSYRVCARHDSSSSIPSSCQQIAGAGTLIATELEAAHERNETRQNATRFGSGATTVEYRKPGIRESDLHDSRARVTQPAASAALDAAAALLSAARRDDDDEEEDNGSGSRGGGIVEALSLRGDAQGIAIKLQLNEGVGGCFPAHYDNPGGTNRRALTILSYITKPEEREWREEDGGELVLLPFLSDRAFLFPPEMGVVVAFRSETVLHYTRPSMRRRLLMTVWIDGDKTNDPTQMQIRVTPGESVHDEAARLISSPAQRLVSRAVYTELYESTLRLCLTAGAHSGNGKSNEEEDAPDICSSASTSASQMLALHHAQVAYSRRNLPLARLVDRLRLGYSDSIIPADSRVDVQLYHPP